MSTWGLYPYISYVRTVTRRKTIPVEPFMCKDGSVYGVCSTGVWNFRRESYVEQWYTCTPRLPVNYGSNRMWQLFLKSVLALLTYITKYYLGLYGITMANLSAPMKMGLLPVVPYKICFNTSTSFATQYYDTVLECPDMTGNPCKHVRLLSKKRNHD